MTRYLLDASVIIALAFPEHVAHDLTSRWFSRHEAAVCPIGEGVLVRFAVREGESATDVRAVVDALRRSPRVEFWADDLSFAEVDLSGVRGHKQVTDTYLVALAVHHGGRLATLDTALAARFPSGSTLLS